MVAARLRHVQAKRFFRQLGHHVVEDDVMDVGARMAYYAMLSLFPMLLVVISIAMIVLPVDTVHQGIQMATETMPDSVRQILTDRSNALIRASGAGFAVLGFVLGIWSASRGVSSLMTALDQVFHKKETRSYVRRQLIAIAVTIGMALLVLVALGLLVLGPIVAKWLGDSSLVATAWNVLRWVGAGLLMMFVWAVLYKFLPDTDAPFRVFTPGSVIGVLLWVGLSLLFGVYLSHFGNYEVVYGALGTVIIFLTWLWLSNMVLLLGAEIDAVLAELRAPHDAGAARLADSQEHAHDRESRTPTHAPSPA